MPSKEHEKLKLIAASFLQSMGCEDIVEEYVIKTKQHEQGNYQVDIYAPYEEIVVECGGTHRTKLSYLANHCKSVYILPYGTTEPVLWNNGWKTCSSCGHIIARNNGKHKTDISVKPKLYKDFRREIIEQNNQKTAQLIEPQQELLNPSEIVARHNEQIAMYSSEKQVVRIKTQAEFTREGVIEYRNMFAFATLREIAEQFHISHARVGQILTKAHLPRRAKLPDKPKKLITCRSCGRLIINSNRIYCNRQCRHDSCYVELICCICDKTFKRERSQVNGGKKRNKDKLNYCSRNCFNKQPGRRPKSVEEWSKHFEADVNTIISSISNYSEDIRMSKKEFRRLLHWTALHNVKVKM